MFHKLLSVSPKPAYCLLLQFSDGQIREYDLKPLFSRIPPFQALKDIPGLFEQVQVDQGGYGIVWNDDLDLSAEELFANGIPVYSARTA